MKVYEIVFFVCMSSFVFVGAVVSACWFHLSMGWYFMDSHLEKMYERSFKKE